MKKSEVNPEEVLKDTEKLVKIINKLDNMNLKDVNKLEEELKFLEKKLTEKYKDYPLEEDEEDLDTEE